MFPLPSRIKIALILIAVAIVGFFPLTTTYDDGLWPVSVTIRSESGRKIVAASAEAMSPGKSADYILKHLAPPEVMICAAQQDPYGGDPLKVPVVANETIGGC